MPRNTSGVYSQPANTQAITQTTISSSAFNTLISDIGSEITASLPRNGSAAMTANLPMGGNRVTGLGAPQNNTDAFRLGDFFPSGTVMLFQQTTAPSGWTKLTTNDNCALRLVSGTAGSGGSTAFTSVFTARTIGQPNLPNVNLSGTGTTDTQGSHSHQYTAPTSTSNSANAGPERDHVWQNTTTASTSGAGAHAHNVTVTVPLGGSGTPLDFTVKYVDVIAAAKA